MEVEANPSKLKHSNTVSKTWLGFWLRNALNPILEEDFKQTKKLSKAFINTVITQYGENQCHH